MSIKTITKLSTEEVNINFEEMMELINKYIPEPRLGKIMKLINEMLENIVTAPASSFKKFHASFSGGFIHHTLNVMKNAIKVDKLYTDSGFGKRLYTMEELIFSALCHDLYKIGFLPKDGGSKYTPNTNVWKQKNYGQMYEFSSKGLNSLPPEEATMFLLSKYDIKCSKNEVIGIKCANGKFSKHWDDFFPDYSPMLAQETNLHIVIHQADFMSSIIENRKFYWNNLEENQ